MFLLEEEASKDGPCMDSGAGCPVSRHQSMLVTCLLMSSILVLILPSVVQAMVVAMIAAKNQPSFNMSAWVPNRETP